MNIVSLLSTKIQILVYKKKLLGKPQILTSSTTIPANDRQAFNLDHEALYLKKTIEQLPNKMDGKKVKLILGQEFWKYLRLELPTDLQDDAQIQFIKSELQERIGDEVRDSHFKYFINNYKGKQFACIYLLTNRALIDLQTLFSFYDLKLDEVYPEALLVFTLFSHTLNKQKEEAALYLEFEPEISTGLLFDSIGLIKEKNIHLKSENLTKELKQFKKDQEINVARLILGGSLASTIRQDNFTKDSTIWTNPLDKVLQNSSLREAARKMDLEKDLLNFNREISLLNFVQNKEEKNLALNLKTTKQAPTQKIEPTVPTPIPQPVAAPPVVTAPPRKREPLKLAWLFKSLFLVIFTSLVTFGIIKGGSYAMKFWPKKPLFQQSAQPSPSPKPQAKPKATPVPSVVLNREEITLEILNGSGTPGLANGLEAELKNKKYQIESVGNAESFDYTNTLIIAPNKAIFNLLTNDLKDYQVTKPKFETTNDQIVTVIIGKDLELP